MNAHGWGKLNMLGHQLAGVRSRASVTRRPPALFYEEGLLKPYVVFDVASGREQRRGGGSLTNLVCHSAYCLPTHLSTEESSSHHQAAPSLLLHDFVRLLTFHCTMSRLALLLCYSSDRGSSAPSYFSDVEE